MRYICAAAGRLSTVFGTTQLAAVAMLTLQYMTTSPLATNTFYRSLCVCECSVFGCLDLVVPRGWSHGVLLLQSPVWNGNRGDGMISRFVVTTSRADEFAV